MIRKNFIVEKAKDLAIKNLKDLDTILRWNYQNNISLFRISSNIFPHFTDRETESYSIDISKNIFRDISITVKKYNHRVLMHPDQYNQVGAISEKVFESTLADLKHHADILDSIGVGSDGVIIVHGGGTYGDKEKRDG
jgi:UV DNA damage endonuclease